ncbi:MAG: hypothetical protein ACODAG_03930 [Myxococcota bacterium]
MDNTMSFEVTEESLLAAPSEQIWGEVQTMDGVNRELAPWVRMTVPSEVRGFTLRDAPLGRPAFRSVLLAFGVLPFDLHHLTLVEATEGRFLERSHSLLQREWEHEREVTAATGGVRVRDRVRVTPRFRIATPLVRPLVRVLFRWRHQRLRRRFGTLRPG